MKKEIMEVILSTAVPDLSSPAGEKRDTEHKSMDIWISHSFVYHWIYKTTEKIATFPYLLPFCNACSTSVVRFGVKSNVFKTNFLQILEKAAEIARNSDNAAMAVSII